MPRTSPALLLAALLLTSAPATAAEGAAAQGIELFKAGRAAEAKKVLEPWAKAHPKDAEAAYYLGRSFFSLRDYPQAIEWLEKATELAPRNAEYQLWLGRSSGRSAQASGPLKAMGLAKRCLKAYEKSVALDPNLLDAREDLMQYYLQAPGMMGGSVEKAKEQAAEIVKRDPVRGAIAQANVAMNQKDGAKAVSVLTAALAKAPGNPRLQMSLGSIYITQEHWDDAFTTFEAVLAADPNHWNALYQVGRTAALSGKRLDQGKSALERYIAGTPGSESPPVANAHYRLGMIFPAPGQQSRGARRVPGGAQARPQARGRQEGARQARLRTARGHSTGSSVTGVTARPVATCRAAWTTFQLSTAICSRVSSPQAGHASRERPSSAAPAAPASGRAIALAAPTRSARTGITPRSPAPQPRPAAPPRTERAAGARGRRRSAPRRLRGGRCRC
jgi:tetratricopeptide (TPR) repeat protein